jgi:hypothetical protein
MRLIVVWKSDELCFLTEIPCLMIKKWRRRAFMEGSTAFPIRLTTPLKVIQKVQTENDWFLNLTLNRIQTIY